MKNSALAAAFEGAYDAVSRRKKLMTHVHTTGPKNQHSSAFKVAVVRTARRLGPLAAARTHSVALRNVKRWVQKGEASLRRLVVDGRLRSTGGGRKRKVAEEKEKLWREQILADRTSMKDVGFEDAHARLEVQANVPLSTATVHRAMKRQRLSLRKPKGVAAPSEPGGLAGRGVGADPMEFKFHRFFRDVFCKRTAYNVGIADIVACDEYYQRVSASRCGVLGEVGKPGGDVYRPATSDRGLSVALAYTPFRKLRPVVICKLTRVPNIPEAQDVQPWARPLVLAEKEGKVKEGSYTQIIKTWDLDTTRPTLLVDGNVPAYMVLRLWLELNPGVCRCLPRPPHGTRQESPHRVEHPPVFVSPPARAWCTWCAFLVFHVFFPGSHHKPPNSSMSATLQFTTL